MGFLKRKISEQFDLGKKFLKNIKPDDRVLLVHHNDIDGICSGVLFLTAFKKLKIKPQFMHGLIEEPEKILEAMKGFDKIVIADVAIDHFANTELKESGKDILFIDHHPPFTDMNSEKIVHINPHFEKEVYQPVAYVAYKFLSEIVDMKDVEWVAVFGTLGDYGFDDCKDLVGKYVKIKNSREIWETDFGKVAIRVGGASLELGSEKIVEILLQSRGLDDVMKNEIISDAYKNYEKEFERCKQEFEKSKEEFDEVKMVFGIIEPKYKRVGSGISTQLSTKNPNKIIMVIEKVDSDYKIHARGQEGKVHLGELVKKCCEGIGVCGGHRNAAGGIIRGNSVDEFKSRVVKELKNVF